MVGLVHQALVILDLVVKFLFDIVLHLVTNEAARNLISYVTQ